MTDEILRDLYERLGGIEAKLDDVRAIRDTAKTHMKGGLDVGVIFAWL